jgi:hypothetical protein
MVMRKFFNSVKKENLYYVILTRLLIPGTGLFAPIRLFILCTLLKKDEKWHRAMQSIIIFGQQMFIAGIFKPKSRFLAKI